MNRNLRLVFGLVGSLPLLSLARIMPGANRGQGRKECEMKPWRILQYAINLAWILLILAGCRETPEKVICMCDAIETIEAYVDRNANGKREPWEEPLQGVGFRVEWRNPYRSPESPKEVFHVASDATGQAQYEVVACCYPSFGDLGTVYAEVEPGYRLTTYDHCKASSQQCVFGFAPLNVTPSSASEADLRGADLNGADLRGEDLSDADLSGANLREADLRGATLRNCQLTGADLQGADLSLADLSHAHLFEADLHGADLRGVNLNDANLNSANLSAANLTGADLGNAKLHKARYDRNTKWPEGFDPVGAGAVLEE